MNLYRNPRFMRIGFSVLGLLVPLFLASSSPVRGQAVDFKPGMPFSDGFIAGKMLFVAGQQGPGSDGKVAALDISTQTENTIAAIEKIVKKAGFEMSDIKSVTVYITDLNDVPKMNEVYKRLMPNPKPARATVQVAGLIGGAKIEISAIAVKQ
ncbi:MAG TPA: RidA family protein [Bryobacteraceae bacterium]|jgi:2-iminobutanoate/2-iminopropanoate deaminase|nr:RidA family protein [Bryobacteraceae bacterium]